MDFKKKILDAISLTYAQEGNTDASSMGTMKSEIVKGLSTKAEKTEATASGAAGAFVPPMSGEMKEKWSEKYKKSIDCNNPRGFSQRAHCQGKKKKLKEKVSQKVDDVKSKVEDMLRKVIKAVAEKED